jgi:TRAP-type C4-dicarboxylate transport system permease small subunit
MKQFERWLSRLSSLAAFAAGLAMFAMMVQVSMDVACKYLLNKPITGTLSTVANYYMVALVFLPLGIVTRDHEHLSIELFTRTLSAKRLALVNAAAGILAVAFVATMFYQSAEEAARVVSFWPSWQAAFWDFKAWSAHWFVPIGTGLMVVYLTIHVIDNVSFFFRGARLITAPATTGKLDLDL